MSLTEHLDIYYILLILSIIIYGMPFIYEFFLTFEAIVIHHLDSDSCEITV